jgi:succinate dehydrogenase / fumarate reductase iron-sulfur subunit
MRFKIFRSEGTGKDHRYDTFDIEPVAGMSVLSALFMIREKFDESLAFRYSCRGAVCGTCAILINRVPRLACRTQVKEVAESEGGVHLIFPPPTKNSEMTWDPAEEILIEPMPNMPVIRDLVVDMTQFFACYRLTNPVFRPAGFLPEKEQHMTQAEVDALEIYTTCILCGACFAACPVNGKNPAYWGPAALAKLFRFHLDPREAQNGSRLATADVPDGWWSCEFHLNCTRVCPKQVTPSTAIGKARQELKKRRAQSQFTPIKF